MRAVRHREIMDKVEQLGERLKWINGRILQIDKRLDEHMLESEERFRLNDERFRLYIERLDISEANWKEERREMEARIAAGLVEALDLRTHRFADYEPCGIICYDVP